MAFLMPYPVMGFGVRGRWVINQLMADLGMHEISAAGIVGNLGYESTGLSVLHEVGQPEGEGGYGWGQWTGPRRETFMAWCKMRGLAWEADEANYGYLVHELLTSQNHALAAVKACGNLEGPAGSVFVFGRIYEAPGGTTATFLPGYEGRLARAKEALGTAIPAPSVPFPDISATISRFESASRDLQTALATLRLYNGVVDGIWGPQSQAALTAYKGTKP